MQPHATPATPDPRERALRAMKRALRSADLLGGAALALSAAVLRLEEETHRSRPRAARG